jgi:hypothetical protein
MASAGLIGGIASIVLGVRAVNLGAKGFSGQGLPWSSGVRIKGTLGKVLGTIDVIIGVVFVLGGLVTMILTTNMSGQ